MYPLLSICCGPRCAAETGHRAVYAAVEKQVALALADAVVRPTLCQGLCGGGITVAFVPEANTPAVKQKIRDVGEARALVFNAKIPND